jgi:A/G-specific adenine glycosylase
MGYNQRAVRLHRAARQIAARGWRADAAGLARIDGIGPFTAAIIASFAFGQESACVDTNVRRVLGRLAGDETVDGTALQRLADSALAGDAPARWNQALMDYGARVCTPRPRCTDCVVASDCPSRERYMHPPRVAEERASYRARPARRGQAPYEGSDRWYRGRIVDALRALPPGRTLAMHELARGLAFNGTAADAEKVRTLVGQLERQGLAAVRRGRVSLPE